MTDQKMWEVGRAAAIGVVTTWVFLMIWLVVVTTKGLVERYGREKYENFRRE